MGASRTYYDVALAVKAGADVVVVDGMQGGTAATQDVFGIEHVGIPTLPATRLAVEALLELGMHRKVQLIVSGGIRSGAERGEGADAQARRGLDRRRRHGRLEAQQGRVPRGLREARHKAGYCHHCHTGRCPPGSPPRTRSCRSGCRPRSGRGWSGTTSP